MPQVCNASLRDELCKILIQKFVDRFCARPDAVACAPGRVNFIGDHNDYQGGFVFPMAIDKRTAVAMSLNTSGVYCIVSSDLNDEVSFTSPVLVPPSSSHWTSYILGTIKYFCEETGAEYPKGVNMVVMTSLPIGSGLSSSAALEVATATAMEKLTGRLTDHLVLARDICQRAEHEWARMPCGLMDQAIATMGKAGHAMLFDCKNMTSRHVPLPHDMSVIVVFTGVPHTLTEGHYGKRTEECAEAVKILQKYYPNITLLRDVSSEMLSSVIGDIKDPYARRITHVVTENRRVHEFVAALEAHDLKRAGTILYEGHASLRDNHEVTTPELNKVVEIAKNVDGVYGARMMGGGFGGSVCVLVDSSKALKAEVQIRDEYTTAFKELSSTFISHIAEKDRGLYVPSVFLTTASHGSFIYDYISPPPYTSDNTNP